MLEGLTYRQLELLRAIADGIADGLPPTIRELGDRLGITSTNGIADHLRALERKGYIERRAPRVARGLRITESGKRLLGSVA